MFQALQWSRTAPKRQAPSASCAKTTLCISGPGGLNDLTYPCLVKNHDMGEYVITQRRSHDDEVMVLECSTMECAIDAYARILFSAPSFDRHSQCTWPRAYIENVDISFIVENCKTRSLFMTCCKEIFTCFDGQTLSLVYGGCKRARTTPTPPAFKLPPSLIEHTTANKSETESTLSSVEDRQPTDVVEHKYATCDSSGWTTQRDEHAMYGQPNHFDQ